MTAIIPFDFSTPAVRGARRPTSINAEVMSAGANFPVISIKGKNFAIVKDGERQLLTRRVTAEDGTIEELPVTALSMAVVRANIKSRAFYAKGYTDGESDGQKPTCFSHDGVQPDAGAAEPQHSNCAACPHAAWGTKMSSDGTGKGTACSPRTRAAVASPTDLKTLYLLNIPIGSRPSFQDAVKKADTHGKDYNEVVMRISFDPEAPTPKLVFTPSGLLTDEAYATVQELVGSDLVMDIVGRPTLRQAQEAPQQALPAPTRTTPQIPAKTAATVVEEAEIALAMEPTPPKPTPARKTTPKPPVKTEPVTASNGAPEGMGALLGELSSILGATDD